MTWLRGGETSLPHEKVLVSRQEKIVQCATGRNRVAFEAMSDEFDDLVGSSPSFEVLAEGDLCAHEAAIYVQENEDEASVVFTTKPYEKRKGSYFVDIKRLRVDGERKGVVEVMHSSCNLANGGTLGPDGRLYFCFQGKRISDSEAHDDEDGFYYMYHPSGIYSVDPATWNDWRCETVNNWANFNSPNDVAAYADGSLWFTDPSYAYAQGHAPPPALGEWVWRIDRNTGKPSVVADGFTKPNGLCFSPDDACLYVSDTGAETGTGWDPSKPRSIYAFDILHGRTLINRRLIYVADTGVPDGLATDRDGRLYAGCADGVHIISPCDGRLIGKIKIIGCDGGAPNLCFGRGKHCSTLYILAETAVIAVALNTAAPSV